jgi:hypothetical protein
MSEKWDERNLFRYDSIPDIVFFFCLSPPRLFSTARGGREKSFLFFSLLCLLFLRPSHWGTNLARTATLERSDFQWQRGEKPGTAALHLSLYKTGRQWAVISHQVNQKCLHRGMGEKKWNGVPRNGPQKGWKADEWRKDPQQKRFEKQNNNIRTNCTGEHSRPGLFSLSTESERWIGMGDRIEARIFGGVY